MSKPVKEIVVKGDCRSCDLEWSGRCGIKILDLKSSRNKIPKLCPLRTADYLIKLQEEKK